MRVVGVLQIPARSRIFFDGTSGRRGEGRGARRPVHIRCSSRLSLAHVAFGDMPFLSSSPALASRARRPSFAPSVRCPWRMGTGSGSSSLNKLVWLLIWEWLVVISHSFLGCHGGGREAVEVLVPNLFKSAVASETGLRLWTRRKCSCPKMCISSSTRSGEASGFLHPVVDRSGRRAAYSSSGVWCRLLIFLLAMMPNGRQFDNGLVFAFSFSDDECRGWNSDQINIPSGSVPGGADFGSSSLSGRRRTRLHSSICVEGLFRKVLGPSCNLVFPWGLFVSCTELQY